MYAFKHVVFNKYISLWSRKHPIHSDGHVPSHACHNGKQREIVFDTSIRWQPPIILLASACRLESLHVSLGISSWLSIIKYPSGLGPKAPD